MKIAVLISGGFDSAVLWHMINKLYNGTDTKIIPVTVPKTDGSIRYANMMLEDYCKRNNIKQVTHSCVTQDRGRCGSCFWCQERAWAFDYNVQLDGIN